MNPREFQDALIQAGVPGETARKAASEIAKYVEERVRDPDSPAGIEGKLASIDRRLARLNTDVGKMRTSISARPAIVIWVLLWTIVLFPVLAIAFWTGQSVIVLLRDGGGAGPANDPPHVTGSRSGP